MNIKSNAEQIENRVQWIKTAMKRMHGKYHADIMKKLSEIEALVFDIKVGFDMRQHPEKIVGLADGDMCNRDGCTGFMRVTVENCSCHIRPPCSACTDTPAICDKCGAEVDGHNEEDRIENTLRRVTAGTISGSTPSLNLPKIDQESGLFSASEGKIYGSTVSENKKVATEIKSKNIQDLESLLKHISGLVEEKIGIPKRYFLYNETQKTLDDVRATLAEISARNSVSTGFGGFNGNRQINLRDIYAAKETLSDTTIYQRGEKLK